MTPTDPTLGQEIRRFERQHAESPGGLAFARLAEAYRRAHRPSLALEVLRDGIQRHPTYPAGHLVRGRSLADLGRLEEAEASFRRVLGLDPGNLTVLRALARLAREGADPEQERRWNRRIQEADPERAGESGRGPGVSVGAGPGREPIDDPPGAAEAVDDPPGHASEGSRSVRDILARSAEEDTEDSPRSAAHSPAERERLVEELSGVAHPGWWSETEAADGESRDSGEDGGQVTGTGSAGEGVVTETMARLYAEQGHWEEAEALYEELTTRRPDHAAYRQRLEQVRSHEVPGGRRGTDEARSGVSAGSSEAAVASDETEARGGGAPGGARGDRTETRPAPEAGVPVEPESVGEHLRALLAGRARPLSAPPDAEERPDAGPAQDRDGDLRDPGREPPGEGGS